MPVDRHVLANERTLMAWLRLAATLGLGAFIVGVLNRVSNQVNLAERTHSSYAGRGSRARPASDGWHTSAVLLPPPTRRAPRWSLPTQSLSHPRTLCCAGHAGAVRSRASVRVHRHRLRRNGARPCPLLPHRIGAILRHPQH